MHRRHGFWLIETKNEQSSTTIMVALWYQTSATWHNSCDSEVYYVKRIHMLTLFKLQHVLLSVSMRVPCLFYIDIWWLSRWLDFITVWPSWISCICHFVHHHHHHHRLPSSRMSIHIRNFWPHLVCPTWSADVMKREGSLFHMEALRTETKQIQLWYLDIK